MPIRLSRFEMPHNVQVIDDEKTPKTSTYTRFVAEPFEIGYARTIGNSLRRVLLSWDRSFRVGLGKAAFLGIKRDVGHVSTSFYQGSAE